MTCWSARGAKKGSCSTGRIGRGPASIRLVLLCLAFAVATACSGHESARLQQTTAQATGQSPEAGCTQLNYGGHDYWVCTNSSSFDEGRAKCKAVGLDLATIDDAAENQFLAQVAGQDAFIGLSDQKVEGAWRWASGNKLTWCGDSQGQPTGATSFTRWANGEPAMPNCQFATQAGRAYWFCNDQSTFDAARSSCSTIGMSLARVDGAAEKNFIAAKLSKPAWLGATDAAKDGDWRWLDGDALFWTGGSTGQGVGGLFSNWGSGNPHASDSANCLSMSNGSKGYWFSEKCDKANTWVCEGPAAPQGNVPDTRDCAVLHDDGDWSAVTCDTAAGYICETVDAQAAKTIDEVAELIRDDYRTGKPRVSHMQFRGDSVVLDPFLRYGERFGLRDCVDGLEESATPDSTSNPLLELRQFRQTYLGVPVYARGYGVLRDTKTGRVESVTGRFEHGIALAPSPQVTEHAAFSLAVQAIGGKANDYSPNRPHGQLVIYPIKQGAHAQWELAWLFELPRTSTLAGASVAVSARDGRRLSTLTTARKQCASASVQNFPTPTAFDISAYQHFAWNDPTDAQGVDIGPTSANRYALYTNAVLPTIGSCSASKLPPGPINVQLYALCPSENLPNVAALSSSSVNITTLPPNDKNFGICQHA